MSTFLVTTHTDALFFPENIALSDIIPNLLVVYIAGDLLSRNCGLVDEVLTCSVIRKIILNKKGRQRFLPALHLN